MIKLVLTLKGREITLSLDEARTLYAELGEIIGRKERYSPLLPPYLPPVIYSSAGTIDPFPLENNEKTGRNPLEIV